MKLTLTAAAVLLMLVPAAARDNGQYENVDPAVRQWYATRELTPEARLRFGYRSCCAHADVVKTQFRVSRGTASDQWFWLQDGTWAEVPPDIIHPDQHAPSGEPVLFAVGGQPVCFFPPDAGI